MKVIKIGKVVNVVGLSGEIKVFSYAENPDRFEKVSGLVLIEEDTGEEEIHWERDFYTVEKVRYKGTTPILKLKGVNDRNGGEKLRNRDVFMLEEELEKLPPGEYYIRELIGCTVISDTGESLGVLKEILTNTAQKLYCVQGNDGKMIYIPGVPQFILEKNPRKGIIKVSLPKGLMEI